MTTKNFDTEWKIAMDWWRSQPSTTPQIIRIVASRRLSLRLTGTGQGISSSDINHEVFRMWKEYKESGEANTTNWILGLSLLYA